MHVAGSGPEYGIYSTSPSIASTDSVILDEDLFAADLTVWLDPGSNLLLDGIATVRVMMSFPPGFGVFFPYGGEVAIPPGVDGLFQFPGDLAVIPIPAGSEVLFEVDDSSTLPGTISNLHISARLRRP